MLQRIGITSRNAAGQETVEVVHEALIHNWAELRQWMNADRSFRAWQDRLRAAMYQWEQTQRDNGGLLRGVALTEAEEKLEQRQNDFSKGERDFIEASVEQRDLLLKEKEEHKRKEEERKERELKQARKIAIGATVAFLFMTGLSIIAFFLWQESQKHSIIALTLSAEARMRSNQQLEAIVSAIRAGKQFSKKLIKEPDVSTQIISTLSEVFYEVNLKNKLEGHTKVESIVFSPNGDTIATASDDKTVKLWSRQGQLLHTLTGHTESVNGVVFSPNGDTIATTSDDKTVKLWSRRGQLLHTLTGHTEGFNSVVFSPNGDTIATASYDKTAKLWSRQGQLLHTLTGHTEWVNGVVFSPNGDTIATASGDKTVKLWNRQGQQGNRI